MGLLSTGSGASSFPGFEGLTRSTCDLAAASASLGLLKAVAILHSLVKVRLPVLGALPSTGRVLISRPCGPLRTCLRAGGSVSHRNHLLST